MDKNYDYIFKIILIGDSGVGKTSLMTRFTDDEFQESFSSTIGVDFKIKTIQIENTKVKLQIWDTAGQERFRAVVSNYYRGANGIFIVFDLTNKNSFIHLDDWISELEKKGALQSSEIMILGNKVDDKEHVKVGKEEIEAFLKRHNFSSSNYLEVSAKEGVKVEEGFKEITKSLVLKNRIRPSKPQGKGNMNFDIVKNRNRCC